MEPVLLQHFLTQQLLDLYKVDKDTWDNHKLSMQNVQTHSAQLLSSVLIFFSAYQQNL